MRLTGSFQTIVIHGTSLAWSSRRSTSTDSSTSGTAGRATMQPFSRTARTGVAARMLRSGLGEDLLASPRVLLIGDQALVARHGERAQPGGDIGRRRRVGLVRLEGAGCAASVDRVLHRGA